MRLSGLLRDEGPREKGNETHFFSQTLMTGGRLAR